MSNFGDLVNIEQYGKKREDFSQDRWEVAFYCKDCKKLVEAQRSETQAYEFSCPHCSGKNIAIGTKEWLKDMYKIKI